MIFKRKKSKRKKISEMVLDFAGDYIAMGEDCLLYTSDAADELRSV